MQQNSKLRPKMLVSEAADILNLTPQGVHIQLKKLKLPYHKLRHRTYFEHESARKIFQKYNSPCKVIVFVLVKGGVGKSTLCREVGIRATLMGKKVLLIDIDHQANLSKSFQVHAQDSPVLIDLIDDETLNIKEGIINVIPGLDILPSRYDNSVLDNTILIKAISPLKALRTRINPLRDEYDLIMIDCPPSLGQTVASGILAADFILLPTTPCDFSDSGIEITVREVKDIIKDYDRTEPPIKIILNQYDNRERRSRKTFSDLLKRSEYENMVLDFYIRKCEEIENHRSKYASIFDTTSITAGREDIDILTRELLSFNEPKPDQDKK